MISTKSTNPILSEAKCISHEEQGVEGGGGKRVINNIMKRLLEFASQIHFLGQVTSFKIMDFLHESFFRSQTTFSHGNLSRYICYFMITSFHPP